MGVGKDEAMEQLIVHIEYPLSYDVFTDCLRGLREVIAYSYPGSLSTEVKYRSALAAAKALVASIEALESSPREVK